MKLIIVGASGFVGNEVLRQSLLRTDVTSVVAVTRRALTPPSKSQKLKNVVVKDYDQYDEEAKNAFKDADGCIWTIAITPTKSTTFPWEEVVRVCQTSTMVGLRAIHEACVAKPFRFLYMSGIAAERDQTKTPSFKPQYSLLRGETENKVLAYAVGNSIEAAVAKPGLISKPSDLGKRALAGVIKLTMGTPSIFLSQIAAAMIDQVTKGFEKEPLLNDDLVKIADRIAAEGRMV